MTVKLQPTYVEFDDTIQYKPTNIDGGLYTVYPQVLYNGIIYQYVGWGTEVEPVTVPPTYLTPYEDPSAEALYQLSSSSSFLLVTGYFLNAVINGNLSLMGKSAVSKSDDIRVNESLVAIFLPNHRIYANGQLKLNITSDSGASANITVVGVNCTVVSETISIGASETNKDYFINFTIKTTDADSSNIQLIGSNVVGNVAINNTSSIHIS